MKHLYFVRHGESVMNTQELFAGRQDTPLTEYGRKQALLAAEEIKPLEISLILSSDLSRARDTAEIIAEKIRYPKDKILVSELFTEQTYGTLEGLPWSTSDWSSFTGIESDDEIVARAKQALDYIRALEEDSILLVSHGSFSRALLAAIHDSAMPTEEPANAKVVRFI